MRLCPIQSFSAIFQSGRISYREQHIRIQLQNQSSFGGDFLRLEAFSGSDSNRSHFGPQFPHRRLKQPDHINLIRLPFASE